MSCSEQERAKRGEGALSTPAGHINEFEWTVRRVLVENKWLESHRINEGLIVYVVPGTDRAVKRINETRRAIFERDKSQAQYQVGLELKAAEGRLENLLGMSDTGLLMMTDADLSARGWAAVAIVAPFTGREDASSRTVTLTFVGRDDKGPRWKKPQAEVLIGVDSVTDADKIFR